VIVPEPRQSELSPAEREQSIREAIILSARRMVAGIEVAKREQVKLSEYLVALDKYGPRGAMSRLARDIGVRRHHTSDVLNGRKLFGAVVARRIAKAKI
jgi:hypothetical protein